ncbi:hypothetical protein GGG16DRAFT_96220 [Schizophyllum commune]
MPRPAPRLNRFPQRLDYTLIPAPLDLSLPDVTEKSPLPAIIVTPSSPSHHAPDYFIAFLAPPPPPTMRERFAAKWKSFRCEGETGPVALPPTPSSPTTAQKLPTSSRSLRTALLAAILALVLLCHVVSHGILQRRHMEFTPQAEAEAELLEEEEPHHGHHHGLHHPHAHPHMHDGQRMHDGQHGHAHPGGEEMMAHDEEEETDAPSWFGWLQPVWVHGERGADFVVNEEELAMADAAVDAEAEALEAEVASASTDSAQTSAETEEAMEVVEAMETGEPEARD